MISRRQYNNPPIVEALVEIHFSPSQEWNPTIPHAFYKSVQHRYSGKPRDRMELMAKIHKEDIAKPVSVQAAEKLDRVQYPDENETSIVAIGQDILSVHVLKPYPGWEDFFERIKEAGNAYINAANPAGVKAVSVRYINKIDIPCRDSMKLQDYFTAPPALPSESPLYMSNFLTRIESIYKDSPIRMVQTFGTADSDEGSYGFLLDFELTCDWPNKPLPCSQAMEVVETMRDLERDAFEIFITDASREVFDA